MTLIYFLLFLTKEDSQRNTAEVANISVSVGDDKNLTAVWSHYKLNIREFEGPKDSFSFGSSEKFVTLCLGRDFCEIFDEETNANAEYLKRQPAIKDINLENKNAMCMHLNSY